MIRTRRPALLLALAFIPIFGRAQTGSRPAPPLSAKELTLPSGTPFPVEIDHNLPMRLGTPIRAHLLYPIYSGDTLLIPKSALVLGSVVQLLPDRSQRNHARLNADFTPFHIPLVRFAQIQLADGTLLPLASENAANGAPIFRIVAPPPRKGGFVHQQFDQAKQVVRDRVAVFTGPDKKDRLVQLLYHQLPYHPERIVKGTSWTVESTAPVILPQLPDQPALAAGLKPAQKEGPPTWMVQAYLNEELNSATTKTGQSIQATVAEPIYNADGTVAVPQGATLLGAVTQSKPARRFGRAGALSFGFRQLVLPGGDAQSVQTSLAGADSATSAGLALNSEGEVKPKPQDKVIVPLLLFALARGPLDHDGGGDRIGSNALASNSLGILGFILGTAARQPNLAAGLGFYGAALSFYDRWIARGKQVTFARDTRIVLQTTARRSDAMKPDSPSH